MMVCALVSAAPKGVDVAENPPVRLDVLVVNDSDFPPVDEASAAQILKAAAGTFNDKFAYDALEFRVVGKRSASEFVTGANKSKTCLDAFEAQRFWPGKNTAAATDKARVDVFLRRWSIEGLQAFFPIEERSKLADYGSMATALLAELDNKAATLAGITLPSGARLLPATFSPKRSYVAWVCALREQDEADIVLTNAFLFYDLASEPFPHTVFQKAKVGGASLASPARRALRGRAVVSSTFAMHTELAFLREPGAERLNAAQRNGVIGSFILAHELGHALFKIPDFYDHPKECLMTTKYETGYVSGAAELAQFPGACSRCRAYVQAKRWLFAADTAYSQGRYGDAIEAYKAAVSATPKHIDGDYVGYLADITIDLGRAYLAMGDVQQARRWLGSVLKRMPSHPRALQLQEALQHHAP